MFVKKEQNVLLSFVVLDFEGQHGSRGGVISQSALSATACL